MKPKKELTKTQVKKLRKSILEAAKMLEESRKKGKM